MDAKQFLLSLRTILPGVEEFLLQTLPNEDLSERVQYHLDQIRIKFNDLKESILQPPVKTDINNDLLETNFAENSHSPYNTDDSAVSIILTPPSPFLCESLDALPIISSVKSLAGACSNSEDSPFSLRITDSCDHSQTSPKPDDQDCKNSDSHLEKSLYAIFDKKHGTLDRNDITGNSNSVQSVSGHISITSGSDDSASDISSSKLETSQTKPLTKKILTKRRQDQLSIRRHRKKSKLTELYQSRNNKFLCTSSSGEESPTDLNQKLEGKLPNESALLPLSTAACDDVSTNKQPSQICHNICSDGSTSSTTCWSPDSREESSPDGMASSEISDQSPTGKDENDDAQMESEYFDKTGKESPNVNSVGTENGIENPNESRSELDSNETKTDSVNTQSELLPGSPSEVSAKPSGMAPRLSVDANVNYFKSELNTKITDFFNPSSVSKVEKASLCISLSSSGSSSCSPANSPSPNPDSQIRCGGVGDSAQDDDVIDIHATPDDAFPSSLSDCDTAMCESRSDTCQLAEPGDSAKSKPSVRSRLGEKDSYSLDTSTPEKQQLIRDNKNRYDIMVQKPDQYKCAKCRENIPVKPGKLFRCKQCFAKYDQIEEFVSHRTEGRGTVFCSHCKIDFKTKCELTQHKQTRKHPNPKLCSDCLRKVENNPATSQVRESDSPAHDIDGSYKCMKCFKRFKLNSQLENHMRHQHMDTNASHFILGDSNHLPLNGPEVWPPPKVTRSPSNQLDADSEITQNINVADQTFNQLKKRI